MARKPKKYANPKDAIKRFLKRGYNQELAGQTKLKHYNKTKSQQVDCALCSNSGCKLHRHRIIPGDAGQYVDENIIVVCVPCHKLIHRYYDETNANDYEHYMIAIMLARLEIAGDRK